MGSPLPARRLFGVAVFALALPALVLAQESPTESAPPAHVLSLEGIVTIERDGTLESATENMPIVPGDRVRTTSGRVEVGFSEGSTLALDENSTIDVLSTTLLRLTSGRALLTVAGAADPARAVRYQIDTPAASASTDGPGEYRVAVLSGRDEETELAVVHGWATLTTERGSTTVRAGERSVAVDGVAPGPARAFNSARADAFDRWVADRRRDRTTPASSASAQYLPRDLNAYGSTFDREGSWQYNAPYGYVWYPTVTSTWRPYYSGRWSALPSYGWTWIGAERWSWPTHHYGRWGHARGSWFWIPGRVWAPAWVSWASAPGYVSWCPLGFDGQPVFALSIGDPWVGWTVIPRTVFGSRSYGIDRFAVSPRFYARERFVAHQSSPVALPRAYRIRGNESDNGSPSTPRRGSPSTPLRAGPSTSLRAGRRDGQTPAANIAAPRDEGRPVDASPGDARTSRRPDPAISNPGVPSPGVSNGDRSQVFRQPLPESPRRRTNEGPAVSGTQPDTGGTRAVPRYGLPQTQPGAEPPAAGASAARPVYRAGPVQRAPAPPPPPSPSAAPPASAPVYRAGPAERSGGAERSPGTSAGVVRRSEAPPQAAPPPSAPPPQAAPPPSPRRAGAEGGSGERAVPRGESRGDGSSRSEGRQR